MRHIELPSGAEAEIRDPADLTTGDQEDALASVDIDLTDKAALSTAGGRLLVQWRRLVIIAGVKSWTVVDPSGTVLPVPAADPRAVRSLSLADANALYAACQPLQAVLFPDFGPSASVDGSPDPSSPTTPSVV